MGRRPQGDAAMTNTERWRRWYAKQHPTKSNDTPGEAAQTIERLKAELAAANAEIWTLKTLQWATHGGGGGRYFSIAEPLAGAYGIHWTATNKPRGGSGEKRPLPEGDALEASFSPWGKNNRGKKTQPLGTFPTLDEARAACQEHARAHPA